MKNKIIYVDKFYNLGIDSSCVFYNKDILVSQHNRIMFLMGNRITKILLHDKIYLGKILDC
jgi:hypothetical protein